MHAGVAAARVGGNRILELVNKYGCEDVLAAMEALLAYGERMTLAELAKLPHGVYEAEERRGGRRARERSVHDSRQGHRRERQDGSRFFRHLAPGARSHQLLVHGPGSPGRDACSRPSESGTSGQRRLLPPAGSRLPAGYPHLRVLAGARFPLLRSTDRRHRRDVESSRTGTSERAVGRPPAQRRPRPSYRVFTRTPATSMSMGEPLVGGWGASRGARRRQRPVLLRKR